MTIKSPELLLPAGSLEKMRAAYDFGADAFTLVSLATACVPAIMNFA
jgi:collagenase-like PrtC family protease